MPNCRKRKESIEDQKCEEDHHKEGKKKKIEKNEADGKGTNKSELKHNPRKLNQEDIDDQPNLHEIYDNLDNLDPPKTPSNISKLRKRKENLQDQEFVEVPINKSKKEKTNENRRYQEEMCNVKEKEKLFTATLCYKLEQKQLTHCIKQVNGKFECPICKDKVKNVQIHFEKKVGCGEKIDKVHFIKSHAEFRKQKRNYQNQIKGQKAKIIAKQTNPSYFIEKNKEAARKSQAKSKDKNKESYDNKHNEAARKAKAKSKCEDKESFNNKNNEANRKSQAKLKYEDKESFDIKNKEAARKSQAKSKCEDKESFDDKNMKAERKSKAKAKNSAPEFFKAQNVKALKIYRETKINNIDQQERLKNFNKAVLFGPIFICSSCSRKLYENGVMKISEKFKATVNEKKAGFYRTCIPKDKNISIMVNGKEEKTGSYICHICKSAMMMGKLPSMSVQNGLHLTKIEEGCHLTELENSLIALNINFQCIFCLQKSRWAGTKKQMISVPVAPETVKETVQ